MVTETGTPVYDGSLAMGLEAEANGFWPWEDGFAEPCVNIARTFFDALIQQNADGEYEGYLAESIEPNEHFTVWTLRLGPDVQFSNGVPLLYSTMMVPINEQAPV